MLLVLTSITPLRPPPQRLDLTLPVRNPRRDLANGFVVADVLSRFFPVRNDWRFCTA